MKNDNQYTLQQGFTLIELMVALTIGLLVSAAALQLFTGGVITTRLQEANAELQDSGIFGLEYVARDVRLANFGNVSNHELHDQTPFGGIV
ncbi:MAG: prepilin-type N-terminal cleavage/methylation domain-containing protein, partial [Acinetobacter sp.]